MQTKNETPFHSFFPNIYEAEQLEIPPQKRCILYLTLFLLTSLWIIKSNAQEPDAILEEIIESLNENDLDNAQENNELSDRLSYFLDDPIRLNKADAEQLHELTLLTEQQVASLLTHISKNGRLISIFELQAVPHFDLRTIHRILPFITVSSEIDDQHLSFKALLLQGNYQLLFRYQSLIQPQAGYDDSISNGYLGSRAKLYLKFRYQNAGSISYGLTAEKDPGESFFRGSQKNGFDFYAAHFYLKRNKGIVKAIALGDYDINFGQGLIAWSGFGYGKGVNVMSIKKTGSVIHPYTSVNEGQFKRGIGLTVGKNSFELTGFASYKKIDGNVTSYDSTTNRPVAVSSINTSGLHRTQLEIEDKKTLPELITGGNLRFARRSWQIGFNLIYTKYGFPLSRSLSLYNQFEFTGSSLLNTSIDYRLLIRNFHFFGEVGMSQNGGFGLLNGMLINLDSKVDLSVLHRIYQKEFQTIYSNAFAENSNPANEHGIFIGLEIRPIRELKINCYVDLYDHPWLKFRTDAPSGGKDYLIKIAYTPSKKMEIYLQYKIKEEGRNQQDASTSLNYITQYRKANFRFHISYHISKYISLKNRFEVARSGKDGSADKFTGYQVYQDISYRPLSFPISFSARFALFQSPSNDVKIYAFENDILNGSSIPSFIGTGTRFYSVIKYKISRHVDIWFRYSRTRFPGQPLVTTTSGISESPGKNGIEGDRVEEVKVQVRFKF